ncbi:zinc finger CCCH domain-containing protein 15 homolog [Convolutriloba macropyga]|uniref:zinc finger CCCH domain-containing protein 15 homolog n=1 Tax=Convolutriloba macropyga TaxID=536237 RepID=UPI003F52770A
MPPKQQVSKKTENKQKEKVIEDKTFGLKNKKGAKQQKFIQQVQSQVKQQSAQNARNQEAEKKKEKDKKQKELDDLNALFKSVEQVAPKGVDPKSVVCEMFKKAKCTKGDKCKFSHDLNVNRKTQKINVFEDKRDAQQGPLAPETFSASDDPTKTDIVCKYFLEAVEKKLYGWFWQCPNGGNACKYRHALPEGYVLKNQKKDDDDEEQKISLEDLIEKERAMISDTTKITLETFLIWKKKKLKERAEQKKSETAKKQADFKKDKTQGLSGREMFTFQASQGFKDDDAGGDGQVFDYKREDGDNAEEADGISSGPVREINLEEFSMQIIEENEAELARQLADKKQNISKPQVNGIKEAGACTDDEPCSSKSIDGAGPSSYNPAVSLTNEKPGPSSNGVVLEIDEELFAQEINQLDDLELSDDEDDDDTN